MLYIYRRFVYSIVILLAIIIGGTIGFHTLSNGNASFLDSFFMTIITITTIGYGEVITFANPQAGRLFTILVAVSGIGAFTFILTNFTAFIVGGELVKSFRKRKMERRIGKISGHYIICGTGDTGLTIASELKETDRDFVLIDKNIDEEHLKNPDPKLLFIQGDATDEEVLHLAGIDKAIGLFAVTGDDNYNLVITFTTKQIRPDLRVVARCRDDKNKNKILKAGADSVVSTNFISSLRIVSEMVRPTVVTFLDIMMRDKERSLRVEEIAIPTTFAGKTINDLQLEKHPDALLMAIKNGEGWTFNPPYNTELETEDKLVLMLTPEERLAILEQLELKS